MPAVITHRQFLAWCYWDEEQLNTPDRHDAYLMQIAYEVYHVLGRRGKTKLKDFILKFPVREARTQAKPRKMSKEEASDAALSVWLGRLGVSDRPVAEQARQDRKARRAQRLEDRPDDTQHD